MHNNHKTGCRRLENGKQLYAKFDPQARSGR